MKSPNAKIGERLGIKTKSSSFEGTAIIVNKKGITLKLFSGYNLFIDKKDIVSIKKIKEEKEIKKPSPKEVTFSKDLLAISILQLGGTIASRVDYETGTVKVSFDPKDLHEMYPELHSIANFRSKLVGKMFSEDIRFAHYKRLALEIKKEIEGGGIKGIIVPHGTDTMHYTAAALAFAFENPPIPIILVGAQRSTDRGSSDAAMNLISAAKFITKTGFKGIGICMHENTDDTTCVILPATKSRKMHTSRRDAFKAINQQPIARIDPHTDKIEFLAEPQGTAETMSMVFRNKFEEKVGIIKARPNMHWQEIDFFRKNRYKGLVIEGTGLGQAPVGVPDKLAGPNKKNLAAIQKLAKSGCTVVMTSQCIYGSVQMHVYQNGVYLAQAGVLAAQDMTTETAYIKLAWLLGNFPREKAKELFAKNLRGEISERTQMNFFPPKWLNEKS